MSETQSQVADLDISKVQGGALIARVFGFWELYELRAECLACFQPNVVHDHRNLAVVLNGGLQ